MIERCRVFEQGMVVHISVEQSRVFGNETNPVQIKKGEVITHFPLFLFSKNRFGYLRRRNHARTPISNPQASVMQLAGSGTWLVPTL